MRAGGGCVEWTIQEVAASAGVTSRTLRHYDAIGLLPPSRVGENGYRYYDRPALTRLQRILLLRDLGLSLPVIAEVLDRQQDEDGALGDHLARLEAERERVAERIRAVQDSLDSRRDGADPSMEMVLEGFNDRYREEVSARWGEQAFVRSNAWWHGKSLRQQLAWKQDTDALVRAWISAWKDGESPQSQAAQELAARHVAWLAEIPGTPMADGDRDRSLELLRCLGRLYVQDTRFAATFGGPEGARFVRDSLDEYARRWV